MKLGFLTAPLPDRSLEELIVWGKSKGFNMIEVACWPSSFESRRYAGTQHIDVDNLNSDKVAQIKDVLSKNDMEISSLAYYPNPLDADLEVREFAINHLKKVIKAAGTLGVGIVGTFVGRDKNTNDDDTLAEYKKVFGPIVKFAEENNVKLAIENCPMLWADRWPGGNNIARSPEIWEKMFDLIKSDHIGLNLDPSHLVWQQIDYVKCVDDFHEKIFHVHAKDTKMLPEKLAASGIYGFGNYVDKLAGLGDINWGAFFSALYQHGYDGVVSIEHEDRAWEATEDLVFRGIELSGRLMGHYVV